MDQVPSPSNTERLETIAYAIKDLVNAADLDQAQRIVAENKHLLLDPIDEVEALFEVMLQQVADQENLVESLRIPRNLLRRCRTVGVRSAFDEMRRAMEGEAPPPCQGPDMFGMIARNTIAVMTRAPKKREQWFATIREIQARAQEVNDRPMLVLLDAVTKLLLGDPLDALAPQLEGEHAACWEHIVQGLNSAPNK